MQVISGMLRFVALLCLLAAPVVPAGGASAQDVLFRIVSQDGKTGLDVTDAVVEKIGTISFRSALPSTDNPVSTVRGPLLRDLIAAAGLKASRVTIKALDGYEMDIPSEDFAKVNLIVAIEVDGQRITRRTRGPGWIAYPSVSQPVFTGDVYLARSVWQIKEIIVK